METGGYYADCALAEKAPQVINVNYDEGQGGKTWQAFGGGKNGHETFRQARFYNFATNASFLHVISNFRILLSKICNIYHVIVHVLPKKHCF